MTPRERELRETLKGDPEISVQRKRITTNPHVMSIRVGEAIVELVYQHGYSFSHMKEASGG